MNTKLSETFVRAWYQGAFWLYLLLPLMGLYALIVHLRRLLYRSGIKSAYRSPLPVVVVGNVSLGGTGKSPLVAYLVSALERQGYRPGIVSRGYGSKLASDEVREVTLDASAEEVGDEPAMLKRRLACPVVVGAERARAIRHLELLGCDIVIADDGLQHYALARDIEICVVDGERGLGNGLMLPAGPLREPPGRLSSVDFVVVNGSDWKPGHLPRYQTLRMDLVTQALRQLGGTQQRSISELKGQAVNAVAAIGNPQRFFKVLEEKGALVRPHAFPDHHAFTVADFRFSSTLPVVMTEKDAVKCDQLELHDAWYVPVDALLSEDLASALIAVLKQKGFFNG